jgi:hypothetical protein
MPKGRAPRKIWQVRRWFSTTREAVVETLTITNNTVQSLTNLTNRRYYTLTTPPRCYTSNIDYDMAYDITHLPILRLHPSSGLQDDSSCQSRMPPQGVLEGRTCSGRHPTVGRMTHPHRELRSVSKVVVALLGYLSISEGHCRRTSSTPTVTEVSGTKTWSHV